MSRNPNSFRVSGLCVFVTVYVSLFIIAGVILFGSLFTLRGQRGTPPAASRRGPHPEGKSSRYYYETQDEYRWENVLLANLSGEDYMTTLRISSHSSGGLRFPYSSSAPVNCSTLQEVTELEFVAAGWTKAVYKGRFRGEAVAVKTVNLNGHDIQECLKRTGTTLPVCYRRAAAKILKEIILLFELAHRNVIKVLGSCVPDAVGPVAMVTELGDPLDTVRLLQLSWEDRLRVN